MDAEANAEFATSSTIKTAVGAAGSTFINPIMTRWIKDNQQRN